RPAVRPARAIPHRRRALVRDHRLHYRGGLGLVLRVRRGRLAHGTWRKCPRQRGPDMAGRLFGRRRGVSRHRAAEPLVAVRVKLQAGAGACQGWCVMQLVIRNGRLHDEGSSSEALVDVLIDDGRFVAIEPAGVDPCEAVQEIDVHGAMLSPPYVEPHVHMDTCLTAGEPRWNESGPLWEGIACWSERKAMLTHDDVVAR